ncbi:hypothetical protein T484DRAFT_1754421 [Baffinella frigidus]|nr:hypothetical protein T484DRAFT_1754421 [Cryptophyta sp. CCMP2293]
MHVSPSSKDMKSAKLAVIHRQCSGLDRLTDGDAVPDGEAVAERGAPAIECLRGLITSLYPSSIINPSSINPPSNPSNINPSSINPSEINPSGTPRSHRHPRTRAATNFPQLPACEERRLPACEKRPHKKAVEAHDTRQHIRPPLLKRVIRRRVHALRVHPRHLLKDRRLPHALPAAGELLQCPVCAGELL